MESLRFLSNSADKLARLQINKALARKQKGSNNHHKARLKLAKHYLGRKCQDESDRWYKGLIYEFIAVNVA